MKGPWVCVGFFGTCILKQNAGVLSSFYYRLVSLRVKWFVDAFFAKSFCDFTASMCHSVIAVHISTKMRIESKLKRLLFAVTVWND